VIPEGYDVPGENPGGSNLKDFKKMAD